MNNVSKMLPLVLRCQDYEYNKKELSDEQIIPPGIFGCNVQEIQTPKKASEERTWPVTG